MSFSNISGLSAGVSDVPKADTYFPYYAFLFTLFYTGLRPSEAVALRCGSVDLAHATLFVERSRSLGAEAAP
jgi:integrase